MHFELGDHMAPAPGRAYSAVDRNRSRHAPLIWQRASPWSRMALVLVMVLACMPAAQAQMGGRRRQSGGQQQTSAPPPSIKVVPEPWPRLDPGAILCKSDNELIRYQMRIAGGSDAAAQGQALDCRVIKERTPIQILDHDGPSRTQVIATDAGKQTGWTDAFLPVKASSH